ncbi:MAG: CoA transferase subunit A [Chloroflexi bacterium]|jgi:3-oxoacid CoA-transferase subunit A|nr:CoA transferase subunit A [Chloroflexota bacterium]
MNKIIPSFEEAVADIPDGASIALNNWGLAGGPQNLILALREQGTKDLTIITQNFMYTPFPEEVVVMPFMLLPQMKKLIAGFFAAASRYAYTTNLPAEFVEMEKVLEKEVIGHGNFVARLQAGARGMGPFYSPVGIGTVVEEGREKRTFDGKEYILLTPLQPDFAFVRADKADKYGNLTYNGTCRCLNPVLAMAGKTTIVEVDELVEPGQLHPDEIVTPAAFVDRIVVNEPGARGSYEYTMKKLHEMLSIPEVRGAVIGQAKQMVKEEGDN